MCTIVLGISNITMLCLIAMFFIIVITIYKVLQKASFFGSGTLSALVAIAVSLLSVLGLIRFISPEAGVDDVSYNSVDKNTNLDFLLTPYIALGITIIIVLLLKFIFGASEKYGSVRFNKEYTSDAGKKHVSENKAKYWKNTDEESRIRK
jgi:hypothetical protein